MRVKNSFSIITNAPLFLLLALPSIVKWYKKVADVTKSVSDGVPDTINYNFPQPTISDQNIKCWTFLKIPCMNVHTHIPVTFQQTFYSPIELKYNNS